MSFSIKFLNKPVPDDWLLPGERGELIEITIGDFVEEDDILTNFWSRDDYINQWLDAIKTIRADENSKAALTTAVHNPENPEHGYIVQWWPLYRKGDTVFIRSSSIPYEEGMQPVDLTHLYDYVPDRDENEEVSEWTISVNELVEFETYLKDLQSVE